MSLRDLANEKKGRPQAVRRLWDAGTLDAAGRWIHDRDAWEPDFGVRAGCVQNGIDEPYSILAAAALKFGECFLSLDIAATGLRGLEAAWKELEPARNAVEAAWKDREIPPGHPAVKAWRSLGHTKALALARTGSPLAARATLDDVEKRVGGDSEITGARARTYKDQALEQKWGSPEWRGFLEMSHAAYLAGFEVSGRKSEFLGVNAAATALWLGNEALASEIAAEIEAACLAKHAEHPRDYWNLATLGEVSLIKADITAAIERYTAARAVMDDTREWGNLSTTRKQAALHCRGLGCDFKDFDNVFRFPRCAVFSGHMVDAPGRKPPRFPDDPKIRQKVADAIGAWLDHENIGFGLCSAACGSDLIFINEMLKRKAEVYVIMPWRQEEFIASSVKPGGVYWMAEYERLREQVSAITCLTQQTMPSRTKTMGFEYCNSCICGLAMLRARYIGAELKPLAVWDGQSGDGPGGTASFVHFWEKTEGADYCKVIKLREFYGTPLHETPPKDESRDISVSTGVEAIQTMLFADVVGYSKITEDQLENFAPEFLGEISKLLAVFGPEGPVRVNTWGDALYLVFDEAVPAGRFALEIRKRIQEIDWEKRNLPKGLNLRIGLHTGPVLLCLDPVLRQLTYTGSHVSHAARIEPVVKVGEIYATEAFVAKVEIKRRAYANIGFSYDYLGQVDLAKHYGRYPLFRLRPE